MRCQSILNLGSITNEIMVYSAYNIDHMYVLQIENTSESDPRSYEATKAVAKKAQKTFQHTALQYTSIMEVMGSNPIEASEFLGGLSLQLL